MLPVPTTGAAPWQHAAGPSERSPPPSPSRGAPLPCYLDAWRPEATGADPGQAPAQFSASAHSRLMGGALGPTRRWSPQPVAGNCLPKLISQLPRCLALTTADDAMTCYAFPPPHGPTTRPAADISSHPSNTVTSQGSPPELPPSRTFSDPPQTLTSLRFMVDPSSSPGICFLSFHIDSCTFKVQESNAPLMH